MAKNKPTVEYLVLMSVDVILVVFINHFFIRQLALSSAWHSGVISFLTLFILGTLTIIAKRMKFVR